jgi:xylulokinase
VSTGLLIGIDLGTTGTRAVLYRADGSPLASAASDTPLRWSGPGRVDQDPEDFVAAALSTIRDCVRAAGAGPGDVAAIGVTGQMAGVLGMGADGRASTPYDSWLDLRCAPQLERLEREHGDLLVSVGGCPPMVNHGPKVVWWREEQPEAFARTAAWVVPGSYVAARLAGLGADEAFVDTTYLHFTGLADTRAGAWSPELAEALGVPERQLARIVDPATVVGGLTDEAARACGLSAGTPIAAGLGDTAAAVLGAGVVRPGQLLDVAGTAAILAVSTDRFVPDEASRTMLVMRGAVEGQWVALAFLSGGSLLPWLAATLGMTGAEGDERAALAELVAEAADVPAGADGLLFVPHLDGRLLPNDPTMRGAWVGLHRQHGRPHLVRAVLESVAYEYAGYVRCVRRLQPGFAPDQGRVVGGGARSALWNDLKASVLGVPLDRLDRDELSCWGAALVAGRAVGAVGDLAEAAERATGVARRHEPDATDHAAYAAYESIYRDALAMASGVGRRLTELGADRREVTAR